MDEFMILATCSGELPRPRGPQDRSGDAEGDAALYADPPDVLEPVDPDRLAAQQTLDAVELLPHQHDPLADPLDAVVREILGDATGPDIGVVHAQPGDEL